MQISARQRPLPNSDSQQLEGNAIMSLGSGKTTKLAIFHSIEPDGLIAPGTPNGWSTMGSWWVTKELSAFGLLEDPIATIREEDERLFQVCVGTSVTPLWVASSPAFAALGVTQERAYPKALLLKFYPKNP